MLTQSNWAHKLSVEIIKEWQLLIGLIIVARNLQICLPNIYKFW